MKSSQILPAASWAAAWLMLPMLLRWSPAAADSIYVGAGEGNNARQQAVALELDRANPVHRYRDADLTAHLHFAYGEIVGLNPVVPYNTIHAGAVIPSLRLQPRTWPFYTEAGVGLALLSKTVLNTNRHFSTSFQFTESCGVGVQFGPKRRLDAGVRVQHVSNGGIKEPNSGISFVVGYIGWRFD
jgi:hypothetical protein